MEYIPGASLRQILRKGPPSVENTLRVISQLCDALVYAHSHGFVHRDIKPENVLLDAHWHVKIGDFGLARIVRGEQPIEMLTQSNVIMGTLDYMSPEQRTRPREVDHRADIYSLGVMFYEMLTGELPLGRFPMPSEKVTLDYRLDHVVLKALEKDPARRYQSAAEIVTEINRIITAPPATVIRAADIPVAQVVQPPTAGAKAASEVHVPIAEMVKQESLATTPVASQARASEPAVSASPAALKPMPISPSYSPAAARSVHHGKLGVIAALCAVTGIFGLTAPMPLLTFWVAAVLGVFALIRGLRGLSQIKASHGRMRGAGFALFGIVLAVFLIAGAVGKFRCQTTIIQLQWFQNWFLGLPIMCLIAFFILWMLLDVITRNYEHFGHVFFKNKLLDKLAWLVLILSAPCTVAALEWNRLAPKIGRSLTGFDPLSSAHPGPPLSDAFTVLLLVGACGGALLYYYVIVESSVRASR
jgi:hypothetical protein